MAGAGVLITLAVAAGCGGSGASGSAGSPGSAGSAGPATTAGSSPTAGSGPAASSPATAPSGGPLFLTASLSGDQEVQVAGKPPVGDPKGHATAYVEVESGKVTFLFRWSGISAPMMAHIHKGAVGANGPVLVPFFTSTMPATATAAAGAVTINDPGIADGIRRNPAGYYVNLHTADFPGGAVRGQLAPAGRSLDMLAVGPNGPKPTALSGSQEVHAPGKRVGDPHGNATAVLGLGADSVSYTFRWIGISPTLGHIHQGAAGANGPVVVPLFMSPVPANVFALAGTVTGVDPGLVAKIRAQPADFYLNLHTAAFPDGALRGQLLP